MRYKTEKNRSYLNNNEPEVPASPNYMQTFLNRVYYSFHISLSLLPLSLLHVSIQQMCTSASLKCFHSIVLFIPPLPTSPFLHCPLLFISLLPLSLCYSCWCVFERKKKKKERCVVKPAKLEQSSPRWYFYPGQQAPPGVYVTHTLPHTLSSYHFPSDTLSFRPCPPSVSPCLSFCLSLTRIIIIIGGRRGVSLQLEALAVCTAVCVLCCWVQLSYFWGVVCVCLCLCVWWWKLGICWQRSASQTKQVFQVKSFLQWISPPVTHRDYNTRHLSAFVVFVPRQDFITVC